MYYIFSLANLAKCNCFCPVNPKRVHSVVFSQVFVNKKSFHTVSAKAEALKYLTYWPFSSNIKTKISIIIGKKIKKSWNQFKLRNVTFNNRNNSISENSVPTIHHSPSTIFIRLSSKVHYLEINWNCHLIFFYVP